VLVAAGPENVNKDVRWDCYLSNRTRMQQSIAGNRTTQAERNSTDFSPFAVHSPFPLRRFARSEHSPPSARTLTQRKRALTLLPRTFIRRLLLTN
jgi:hypothetical protein